MTSLFFKGFILKSDGGGGGFKAALRGHSGVLLQVDSDGWAWPDMCSLRRIEQLWHSMEFGLASLQQRDQAVPRRSAKINLQLNLKHLSHLKTQSAENTTILKCRPCTGMWHNFSCLIIIPLLKFWMQKSTACWMIYTDKAAGTVTRVFPSRFGVHTQKHSAWAQRRSTVLCWEHAVLWLQLTTFLDYMWLADPD